MCAQLQQLVRDAVATITLLAEHDTISASAGTFIAATAMQSGQVTVSQASTGRTSPPKPAYAKASISQASMTIFFSQWEWDLPQDVLDLYLRDPELMRMQNELKHDLLQNWQDGGAPFTPEHLYQRALELANGDKGVALLVCHNVTKAFARGGDAISWQRLRYYQGNDAAVWNKLLHYEVIQNISEDDLNRGYVSFDSNGQPTFYFAELKHEQGFFDKIDPSIFYLLFDPQAFGTEDAGDWYHFFVTATASYYGSGPMERDDDYGQGRFRAVLHQVGIHDANEDSIELHGQAESIEVTKEKMKDLADDTPFFQSAWYVQDYDGWRWANALSFMEGVSYGIQGYPTQEKGQWETSRESRVHKAGAEFGLLQAGVTPDPQWQWFVPIASDVATQISTKRAEGKLGNWETWNMIGGHMINVEEYVLQTLPAAPDGSYNSQAPIDIPLYTMPTPIYDTTESQET